jgi:group I intron endonuclease
MKEIKSGIYCIEKMETGQQYIGKGKNLIQRMWTSHKECKYIYRAINKYGEDAFCRYVVEYCEPEMMAEREQYYIKLWNTKAPNGYNLSDGGEGLLNPSDEIRERKRIVQLGKNNSFYGKNHTDEWKENASKRFSGENHPNYGKTPSLETRKSMSENHADFNGKNNPAFGTKQSYASSLYYGICKSIKGKYICWQAKAGRKRIGYFKTELEAAEKRDEYIIKNNLDYLLNFPEKYGRDK